MRESSCEQGLYPRAALILVEMIKLYKDLAPAGIKIIVHPMMSFCDTDTCMSTDYVVVVVSAISFLSDLKNYSLILIDLSNVIRPSTALIRRFQSKVR